MPGSRRVHVERRGIARPPDRFAGRRVERGHHLVLALAAEHVQAVADQHRDWRSRVRCPPTSAVAACPASSPARRRPPPRRRAPGRATGASPAPRRRHAADQQRHNRRHHERAREVCHRCLLQVLIRGSDSGSAPIVRAFDRRREDQVTSVHHSRSVPAVSSSAAVRSCSRLRSGSASSSFKRRVTSASRRARTAASSTRVTKRFLDSCSAPAARSTSASRSAGRSITVFSQWHAGTLAENDRKSTVVPAPVQGSPALPRWVLAIEGRWVCDAEN